jgi:Family of unknown function (DUF6519)
MRGDFTRDTFDATRHFSRVLMQQGRVQLDADSNEQASILLHYLQALAADLIGPHGGPANDEGTEWDGFRLDVTTDGKDFAIHAGHYYVKGLLCENDARQDAEGSPIAVTYFTQPDYPLDRDRDKLTNGSFLVYLDVWERHLTYLEVEDAKGSVISIREAALNGPDTATRAQVVWQVKTKASEISVGQARNYAAFLAELGDEVRPGTGRLRARAVQPKSGLDAPCITSPESRYRGAENQLYRVEIHDGGTAQAGATFKWSRENGSVIFPIRQISDKSVILETLGRDSRLSLEVGDLVEIVDDDYTLRNRAERLLEVEAVDYNDNVVTLKDGPASMVGQDAKKHPLLRRWDQRETEKSKPNQNGVLPVSEVPREWIDLEDGVQIQFQRDGVYRRGDYWLIPARTATGDVEWPGPVNSPLALPPRGVKHYYAPLWIISVLDGSVTVDGGDDLRRRLNPI